MHLEFEFFYTRDVFQSFTKGDVIGNYLDLEGGQIAWSKNGVVFDIAYDIEVNHLRHIWYPAIVLKNAEMRLNFGDTPFRHPPEYGHVGYASSANLVASEVQGGATQVQSKKKAPNAPYAIILEVFDSLY